MKDLFGDKVTRAQELLRQFQPKDKLYYGCFSGGKDSIVIKDVLHTGNIGVIWHLNVTTIDPPELMRFVKKHHGDVVWEIPKIPFFKMAEKRGFPTRRGRWCCSEYKEDHSPRGEVMVFGVRAAESPRRAKTWKEVTAHTRTGNYVISPIIDWTDSEVWQYIKSRNLPYCELYDQGFKRLGCVGCPMASNKKFEMQRWPHYERAWKRLFKNLWERRTGTIQRNGKTWFGNKYWSSWEGMYEWYLSGRQLPNENECQGLIDYFSSGNDTGTDNQCNDHDYDAGNTYQEELAEFDDDREDASGRSSGLNS
jgi:phosphoadenosine phosphosulfate reductase